ncbi:phosphatidylserine decarboxylase-domain-containing protein [Daedaleopsis nitida]|nr:phosphatidylserine decarboxylase-domain-containing protein [Daedaleopsis nitida]
MQVYHRIGGWLPKDHRILQNWLDKHIAAVEARHKKSTFTALHPVIQEFKELIEGDSVIRMGFHQMFEQVPHKPPYCHDPTGKPQVRDYNLMLELFNDIIATAPEYENNALVGFPINAIIDWPMGTPAGYQMFTTEKVNVMFKKMFDVWGWFGPGAMGVMPNFVEEYECDPEAPYWGFASWDHFFTRAFRPGVRPVDFPQDDIVTSACESTVIKIQHDVQRSDRFWLKEQPYSLEDMLHFSDLVEPFVGGTVYQAFLSATKYHRWHSPVNGRIRRVVNIPGTYYTESLEMGFDPAGPDLSQAFITNIAARALVYIEAAQPVGLLCFVAIGMAEVSSCEITVKEGDRVSKGDEIGMFHFGGSTHCLVFNKNAKVSFPPDIGVGSDVLLNSAIATVSA